MEIKKRSPKSGDIANIVWNVVDNSLSTTFKKLAMRYRFYPIILLTLFLHSNDFAQSFN